MTFQERLSQIIGPAKYFDSDGWMASAYHAWVIASAKSLFIQIRCARKPMIEKISNQANLWIKALWYSWRGAE